MALVSAPPKPIDHTADLVSIEAEQALLGAMLFDTSVQETLGGLEEGHFFEPAHARIFAAIMARVAAGLQAEGASIAVELKDDPALTELGGRAYLGELLSVAYVPHAATHAATIRGLAIRRQAVAIAADLIERAKAETDVATTLAAHEAAIVALSAGFDPGEVHLVDARTAARTTLDRMEEEARNGKPRGLMTGLRCFDYRCRGLRPGWLIILGGRPSMGKTALARSSALGAAYRNPDFMFVYFALEMDREELSHRTLSEISFTTSVMEAVPFFNMMSPLDPQDLATLRRAEQRVPENFKIEDSAVLSVSHIRRRLRALKRKGKIGAVFIDYLQIMEKPPAAGRNEASVIGEMTASLKQLARELGICIVLLSQLGRQVEQRENKRPQMSDLLDSGKIEADANAVLLCYRDIYYLEKNEPAKGSHEHGDWLMKCEEVRRQMDIFMPKVRGGPTGRERQVYFAEYDHIEDGGDPR